MTDWEVVIELSDSDSESESDDSVIELSSDSDSEECTGGGGKPLEHSNVTIRKKNRFRDGDNNNEIDTQSSTSTLSETRSDPTEIVSDSSGNEAVFHHVRSRSTNLKRQSTKTFLESLNDDVPLELAHPDSRKFKKNFKTNRCELVEKLMALYNEKVFEMKLSHVPYTWSKWIGNAAGCYWLDGCPSVRQETISLNDLFVTSAERLRDVLLHEMCHAAVWAINKQIEENDGHGPLWQSWGDLAKKVFPEIPPIQRYSNYEITQKFKYKCTMCWGSSLSKSKFKRGNTVCELCNGPVELFRIERKNGRRVTVALRKPGSFALFIKEHYKSIKTPDITHADVMKELSERYSKLTAAEKQKYGSAGTAN